MMRVVLTTGGTGGHIFPALAVAEALRSQHKDVEIVFAGSLYGPEKELAEKAGLTFVGFAVRGFLGRGLRAVGAAAGMGKALIQAVGFMRRFRPDVVVGFGGYAAFAPVMAARLCGIPTAIHEQNAVAGVSNKVLALFANKVFLSMQGTEGFAAGKCVYTGNPVRDAVAAVGQLEHDFSGKRLLVVGGSQGAKALNEFIITHLDVFARAGVSIRHQTGARDYDRIQAAYEAAGISGEGVSAFIDQMADAYAWADLVLCRSGASTVTELAAAGRGAVLVPFPYATHDHQTHNARLLSDAGAGLLVEEKQLASEEILQRLLSLLDDAQSLNHMGRKAAQQGKTDAAVVLAAQIYSLAQSTR